jgi:repressor LexA
VRGVNGAAEPELYAEGRDIGSGEAERVPFVGRIAAGIPITADEQVEDIFSLPRQLVGEGSLFMLKVAGDSMINAAIADGTGWSSASRRTRRTARSSRP